MTVLQDRLDCSRASVYRVVDALQHFLGAPVINERGSGFRYDPAADAFDLPGLWFNASEIHALLAFQRLLSNLGPGLLDAEIEPFRKRIEKLLKGRASGTGELERRIRIIGMAARDPGGCFNTCASALVGRKRVRITYRGRARDAETHREVSPQRLVHYRENWYLDGWCHDAKGLRSFATERIRRARILGKSAREIADETLNEHFAAAYGIFAGKPKGTAVLRFTANRARWIADEHWHGRQEGRFVDDGSYELRVPYGNPTELVMDILKYGPDVEVVAPRRLRQLVEHRLDLALKRYRR